MSVQHRRGRTNLPVAIEVLVETGLECLQRSVSPRHNADIRDVVAVIVGGPHRILISSRNLPGNLISGRRLLRGNRRPRAGDAGHARQMVGAGNLQRGARTRAVIKIILIANLGQTGRAIRLDYRCDNTDLSVAIEVLVEAALERSNAVLLPDTTPIFEM